MQRFAWSAVLVALLFAGSSTRPSFAGEQHVDFDARRAEARVALQKDLEAYVEWCQTSNLFNERKKALEILLELDPAHAEALKTLGWARDKKSGVWSPPAKPKEFRDFDKQALERAPARWREATGGYVAAMTALLEAGGLTGAQRELAARDALRFDPGTEHVHTLLGEVKSEKGWVLPETVRAKERRAVLRAQVQSALEQSAARAAPAPLNEREKKFPLRFEALVAPGLRVVGTTSQQELELTAQAVLALQDLLAAVFETKHALPADTTVFLLSDPRELPAFVDNHPAVTAAQRAELQKLEGGGIQGTNDFAFWTGDMQRRIDGVVRLLLGYWLSGAFEINVSQGWAYEGFGLFLTRSLVRTRMTWLAQPSTVLDPKQDMALRQKLMDPATNWMDEALRVLQEKRHSLPELFRKSATQLTTEDVLVSYVLATYLLEVRAEVVPEMLARVGTGYSSAQAFQEALGMDLVAFEPHLLRWLAERN